MTAFPLNLPASFRFLTARQDAVSDKVVEMEDARGQILVQDHGAPQWMGNFTLIPMTPNDPMYNDWRTFTSQLQQSFGTFRIAPVDVLTGQRYSLPSYGGRVAPAPAGATVVSAYFFHIHPLRPEITGLKWFTHEDNLYEIINETAEPDINYLTINPPLITTNGGFERVFSEEDAYCIARATTITHPTITPNGLYQGASIFWEQDIQI